MILLLLAVLSKRNLSRQLVRCGPEFPGNRSKQLFETIMLNLLILVLTQEYSNPTTKQTFVSINPGFGHHRQCLTGKNNLNLTKIGGQLQK